MRAFDGRSTIDGRSTSDTRSSQECKGPPKIATHVLIATQLLKVFLALSLSLTHSLSRYLFYLSSTRIREMEGSFTATRRLSLPAPGRAKPQPVG